MWRKLSPEKYLIPLDPRDLSGNAQARLLEGWDTKWRRTETPQPKTAIERTDHRHRDWQSWPRPEETHNQPTKSWTLNKVVAVLRHCFGTVCYTAKVKQYSFWNLKYIEHGWQQEKLYFIYIIVRQQTKYNMYLIEECYIGYFSITYYNKIYYHHLQTMLWVLLSKVIRW